MFLVKSTNDPDVPRYVLDNLLPPIHAECAQMTSPVRDEAIRALVRICFQVQLPDPRSKSNRRPDDMAKLQIKNPREQYEFILKRQKEDTQKLQKEFLKQQLKQQLQKAIKTQQKQQQEMATIWRDLMKIEDETLIRKMNDPNPLVSLLSIQAVGKMRLPVEKECIALLTNANPTIRQAARQTLIRLGRGVDFGPDASAPAPQIAASVRSWNSWLALQANIEDNEEDATPKR